MTGRAAATTLCAGILAAALLVPGCGGRPSPPPGSGLAASGTLTVFDHHVHVLSPALVERWKTIGVPFSKPDYAYSDIDSIFRLNPARGMFLISMAYLFGSPEFSDTAERSNVERENAFVADFARRHPDSLYAFCSVNPLREYAGAEILRCRRELGMHGLKLHFASSGVSLREPAHLTLVRGIFSLAAAEGMPVILHFDNQTEDFGDEDARILIDSVLVPGPAMELFIAHLGTAVGYTYKTRMIVERFSNELNGGTRLSKHRLWFDISAVALRESSGQSPALTPADFADLSGQLTRLGLGRVVFGTDYPVYNTIAYLSILESEMTLTREELTGIAGNGMPGEIRTAAGRR